MEFYNFTIKEAHEKLVKKEISSVELTKNYLEQIKEKDSKIDAFLEVSSDLAMRQAEEVDKKIKNKEEVSFLAGIPVAIKDNILVEGVKCTAASKILENYVAPYDATVTKKLKEKDCVILGKTNMDEFAMGGSTETSAYKKTKNPNDLERVPGGSSGGSAASVAANECVYSLGSDTGGSIRQPASFCGVVGLKPTYGSVSRYGLMAMASSLDQIGPLTKTVEDSKIVFDAIKGKDKLDSTSVDIQSQSQLAIKTLNNLRVGLPKEYFLKGVIDPEVEKIIKEAVKKYEGMGVKFEEISLPNTEHALAVYYIIMPSEVSANLARYDGIKYGFSTANQEPKTGNLLDVYLQSREQGFGEEAIRRIILGTYALSSGYYDAYYLKAQKVRTLIKNDFENSFKKVDFIMTPVSPFPAFKIGEKIQDPLSMYLSDIFTVSVNLAGLPAISIPCGKVGKLPVGLQIIGPAFSEEGILNIAQFL